MKHKDLTNKVFHNLTASHVVDKPSTVNTKNRGTWWMCKCTCGKENQFLLAGHDYKILRVSKLKKGIIHPL